MNTPDNQSLTVRQFANIKNICRDLFAKKLTDYGSSWRVMRAKSLTDQIFIKAKRIRNIEESKDNKVGDSIDSEFIGIVNYGIIGLIQLELQPGDDLAPDEAMALYDKYFDMTTGLMLNKNHDYGEVWRDMRTSSFTDIILTKIKRTKQIEDNDGDTLISEGIDANYMDIINYAIFALIKLGHGGN